MNQNTLGSKSVAPLTNVRICLDLIQQAINAPKELGIPRMVMLYGPSGYGKTTAIGHVCAKIEGDDEKLDPLQRQIKQQIESLIGDGPA